MKKTLITIMIVFLACARAFAGGDIVKTGLNIGPLPVVAFDADKGFQYGAILQLFNYGDGHNYPNYDSKTYLEYSRYTKGSQLIQLRYDNKELIPNVRWSSTARINLDKAYDFYGFNGYVSDYGWQNVEWGKTIDDHPDITPYYRYSRKEYLFKSDFLGRINDHLQWEAGVFCNYFDLGGIDEDNINKGKDEQKKFHGNTLYDLYTGWEIFSADEADGGLSSGLRAGIVYDTRDKEGAPSKGIWAEAHLTGALPGISETPYLRYSATWRQYLPIIGNDVLTFAYRLNYEGSLLGTAPFYVLSYMTVMGEKNDLEGMGGYNTVRGLMRTRVLGDDMATYNAEFRWRFMKFNLGKQNIALGLSAFSDGTMVTRKRYMPENYTYYGDTPPGSYTGSSTRKASGNSPFIERDNDLPHITFGGGFRFIMNENFIVAAEYGTPLTHFMKNSPLYNQDGTGAFYVNLGYLF